MRALQNRVMPTGEIVAVSARGTLMGNRGGSLHGADKRLGARRWASKQWICCQLDFKGRRREMMARGRYTELFFLDEATALAAGHRPCFECRREAARRFAQAWACANGSGKPPTAPEMDAVLHAERLDQGGGKRLHAARLEDLPRGAMFLDPADARPRLVVGHATAGWTLHGYRDVRLRERGPVDVLTPPSIIAALNSGYTALLHETARHSR